MRKYGIIISLMVAVATVVIAALAFAGDMMSVKTDKTVYLMDPYYWVYDASKYTFWYPPYANPGYWPEQGYPRDIGFTVRVWDGVGKQVDKGDVYFRAIGLDGSSVIEDVTLLTPDPEKVGVYKGIFQLWDADLGSMDFTGWDPAQISLQVLDSSFRVLKTQAVPVGRWGCDRCHVGYTNFNERANPDKCVPKSLYPWSGFPDGGPAGPHNWGNILGRIGSTANAITIETLLDSTKAHIPGDILSNHERTIQKQCGNKACSPCHQGTEGVAFRHPWGLGYRDCWVDQQKSQACECTFCHGMDGGYTPTNPETGQYVRWASVGGYVEANHKHSTVPVSTGRPPFNTPWLSRQTCSNPGCHGHINSSAEKRAIDNAKPDCRVCHGIHSTPVLP